MGRLQGKIALVTGAAQGIGEGITRAFALEGATVWATDVNEDGVRAVARSLGPGHRSALLDVTDEAQWDAVMNALLSAHGRIDVLVNNAGITGFEDGTGPHDPEHASLDEWHRVHRVNLDGTFLGCRAALRAMRASGEGSIINMSSRSGLVGIPGAAAYASSKAAIRNHSKSVAL